MRLYSQIGLVLLLVLLVLLVVVTLAGPFFRSKGSIQRGCGCAEAGNGRAAAGGKRVFQTGNGDRNDPGDRDPLYGKPGEQRASEP